MRRGIKALSVVPLLGLMVLVVAQWRGTEQQETGDFETVRTQLRERLAKGELSEAEAQVRFAEAFAESKRQERGKGKVKLTPELEALGEEIKEQVDRGEMTVAEAKAKWREAKRQAEIEGAGKGMQRKSKLEGADKGAEK